MGKSWQARFFWATIDDVDPRHAELLTQCDPSELGQRVRAIRVAQGLTLSAVAGSRMSVAHLSRIESGHRRATARMLQDVASALNVPVEQLLGDVTPRETDEIRLLLDYAELSLESGQAQDAASHVQNALERLESVHAGPLHERARLLNARVAEALGDADAAIIELERIVDDERVTGLLRIRAGIALSRIYRESGDLGRAIDSGERILANLTNWGLDSCDEAVQLSVTIAAAHFERGDAGHAVRVCRTAIERAETLGSPTARASAYWNTSVLQANRGDIASAVDLAERALALLSEGQDARNIARMRALLGRLQLTLDPPAVADALHNLEQAAQELEWSSASPVDRAYTQLGLARASMLSGDLIGCRERVMSVHRISAGRAPLTEAEAMALEGQTYAAEGDVTEAAKLYQEAVMRLSAAGADHGAAQLWFDLAGLLDSVEMGDAARDAYRRAAASTGLRARMSAPSQAFV